jgi:hypothetical protein
VKSSVSGEGACIPVATHHLRRAERALEVVDDLLDVQAGEVLHK